MPFFNELSRSSKIALAVTFAVCAVAAYFNFFGSVPETPESIKAKLVAAIDSEKKAELAKADAAHAEYLAKEIEKLDVKTRIDALTEMFFSLESDIRMAKGWVKSCQEANILGTLNPAVDCDTIPAVDEEAETASGSASGVIASVMTATIDGVLEGLRGSGATEEEAELKIENPEQELISEVDRSDSHLAEIAKNLIWRYNAKGFAQSPVGLTASGVEARTKQVLRAYKFDERFKLTKDYGYELFKKVGARYSIKPEMLVCVAKADSSLGRWLTTGYNIGNVGNNDRGNRVHLDSIGAGIDHIGKALSNKWLGYKQSVGSLSPVGGGDAPFYSTSPEGNWYNNVRNCLAEIHDDPTVGPDWMFRN